MINGNVSARPERSYWYDYSPKSPAETKPSSPTPPTGRRCTGRSLAGYQQKSVLLNDGAGPVHGVAQAVGVTDVYDGRSIALADFENRGVLDVVSANAERPAAVLPEHRRRRTTTGSNSTCRARRSNRSAIGADVPVYWNGQQQLQEVRRQRVLRAESRASAFRSRQESAARRDGSRSAGLRADRRRLLRRNW